MILIERLFSLDTLISNVTAVTMNTKLEVIFGAYIGIDGGKIVSISKSAPEEPPRPSSTAPEWWRSPVL